MSEQKESQASEKKEYVPITVATEVASLQELVVEFKKLQDDQGATLDAVKELTKVVGELRAEWEKWRKAGKF